MDHLFCAGFGGCNTDNNPVPALEFTGNGNVVERLDSNDKYKVVLGLLN